MQIEGYDPTTNKLVNIRIKNVTTDSDTNISSGDISVSSGYNATDIGKSEDTPFAQHDVGIAILGVRNDDFNTLSSDGNYSFIKVDRYGRIGIIVEKLTDAVTGNTITSVDGVIINSADGKISTLGSKADSSTTDHTATSSAISLLKGLIKILSSVWDSANNRLSIKINGSDINIPIADSVIGVPYHNITAATTNFTNTKSSATKLLSFRITNTSGSTIYFCVFNKASAPTTGDVPITTIGVNANSTFGLALNKPISLSLGFSWCCRGGVADNDNTNIAANCVVDFDLST